MSKLRTISEMPMAAYKTTFKDAHLDLDKDDLRGHFSNKDRVILNNPKTTKELTRILAKHPWNFNILLVESGTDRSHDYSSMIYRYIKYNNIPIEGHITFAKNGSSGDNMSAWMILHTLGHALFGLTNIDDHPYQEANAAARDEIKDIYLDVKKHSDTGINHEFIDSFTIGQKMLQTKSARNWENPKIPAARYLLANEEVIFESFADYIWTGHVRLRTPEKWGVPQSVLDDITNRLGIAFKSRLDAAVGTVVFDYFL